MVTCIPLQQIHVEKLLSPIKMIPIQIKGDGCGNFIFLLHKILFDSFRAYFQNSFIHHPAKYVIQTSLGKNKRFLSELLYITIYHLKY